MLRKYQGNIIYVFSLFIWSTPLWHHLKLGVIYASFSAKSVLPKFQSLQKHRCLASLAQGKSTVGMTTGKDPLLVLCIIFFIYPFPYLFY